MRDPGNAETVLRIADWFGISDVYTSPESVFRYNPKLVQSSMGSIFRVGYHTLQIEQIKGLKNKLPIMLGQHLKGNQFTWVQKWIEHSLCLVVNRTGCRLN